MFEAALKEKLQKIFEVQRVRFDDPGESPEAIEQETLFVQIESSKNTITEKVARARVQGRAVMIAQNEKLPYGYFSKCIAQHPEEAKDLAFFDIEENTRLHHNLCQRGFSFVYFFNSQYDPAVGTITSIELEVSE